MENKNSYFLAGLFFVIAFLGISSFILYMNMGLNKKEFQTCYIQTSLLPSGIKEGSSVLFMGVKAGFVETIYFSNPKEALIEIKTKIKKDLPVSKDSYAIVEMQGISGLSSLNIIKGKKENFNENEKIIIPLGEGTLDKIMSRSKSISEKFSVILNKIDEFLSKENEENLSEIIFRIDRFSKTALNEENAKNIGILLKVWADLGINLNENSKNFNIFLNQSSKAMNEFSKLEQNFNSSLKNSEFKFSDLKDTNDNLNKTLDNFQALMREIDNALFRLEKNPYEFFFKDRK